MTRKLQLLLPILRSKKNAVRIRRTRDGRYFPGKDGRVKDQEDAVRAAVIAAAGAQALPLFGAEDDIAVTVRWLWLQERVYVTVESLGPPPRVRGRTGRGRDLGNMLDTLLDALQGAAYADDRQVARVVMVKETRED